MSSVSEADRKFALIWFCVGLVVLVSAFSCRALLSGSWNLLAYTLMVCSVYCVTQSALMNRPRSKGGFLVFTGVTIVTSSLFGYPLVNYLVPIVAMGIDVAQGSVGQDVIPTNIWAKLKSALSAEARSTGAADKALNFLAGFAFVGLGIFQGREPLIKTKLNSASEITSRLKVEPPDERPPKNVEQGQSENEKLRSKKQSKEPQKEEEEQI